MNEEKARAYLELITNVNFEGNEYYIETANLVAQAHSSRDDIPNRRIIWQCQEEANYKDVDELGDEVEATLEITYCSNSRVKDVTVDESHDDFYLYDSVIKSSCKTLQFIHWCEMKEIKFIGIATSPHAVVIALMLTGSLMIKTNWFDEITLHRTILNKYLEICDMAFSPLPEPNDLK